MRAISDSPPRARPGSLPAAGCPMLGCRRLTSHFRFAPRVLLGTVGGFARDGTSPPASWGVVALSVAFLASSARSLRARRERLPHTATAELHSGQRSGEMKQVAGVGRPCSFAHVWGGDGSRGLVETAQAAKSSAATSAEVGRLRRIATRCQSCDFRRRLKSQARGKVQPRAPTWSRGQRRAWPTAAVRGREVFSSRILAFSTARGRHSRADTAGRVVPITLGKAGEGRSDTLCPAGRARPRIPPSSD